MIRPAAAPWVSSATCTTLGLGLDLSWDFGSKFTTRIAGMELGRIGETTASKLTSPPAKLLLGPSRCVRLLDGFQGFVFSFG